MPANAAYVYVAVVHGVDAVQFITAAQSQGTLTSRLVEYVRGRAETHLAPTDAQELHRLLASEQLDAAVSKYFTTVGTRWDEERLLVERIEVAQ
jgi:hypothetical protein